MTESEEEIIYSVKDLVATIRINRPERRNSVTADNLCDIELALDKAAKDPEVAVIVFTGTGDKAFCAGADVGWQKEGKMGRTGVNPYSPPYMMFTRCQKPIIAAVNGIAIGGGNHFAYFCDFTIAAEHAEFGQSEPRVAYPASGPVVSYLTRIIGHKRAREMWMLGRRYSASQMLDWGLVNAVVPYSELEEEVSRWCSELTAVSPTCLKLYKSSFISEFEDLLGMADFRQRFQLPGDYFQTEQQEGIAAFQEKRQPDFSKWR
ncbi:MAG: enoyl-CoA hydratase-related protein [Gammaproteobacteria bacterium]|nr:enoyl-CoA hydratase-related protein [Gammaproteobacteria bacterium]